MASSIVYLLCSLYDILYDGCSILWNGLDDNRGAPIFTSNMSRCGQFQVFDIFL